MSSALEISNQIYIIRNQRVMLDSDLAKLYEVSTKRLNEQVKRNLDRFPLDFMFRLTKEEDENLRSQSATSSLDPETLTHQFHNTISQTLNLRSQSATSSLDPKILTHQFHNTISETLNLRSQIATSSLDHGGKRHYSTVFTVHGASMLSCVLETPRAIEVNMSIVRAFSQFQETAVMNQQFIPILLRLEDKMDQLLERVYSTPFQIPDNSTIIKSLYSSNTVLTNKILNTVAKYFALKPSALQKSDRSKPLVLARNVAIYLLRKHQSLSFLQIAKILKKKNHTTILHSFRKVELELDSNALLQKDIQSILSLLN